MGNELEIEQVYPEASRLLLAWHHGALSQQRGPHLNCILWNHWVAHFQRMLTILKHWMRSCIQHEKIVALDP